MTPADKRVMELLDRWLTSVELHMKYAALDDARYQQIQPWPKHERPARWILELAQQKVLSLKTLCKAHCSDNDPSFAEAMELMCFLANLVGAQHIQRFIPLADPAHEQAIPAESTPVAAGVKQAQTSTPAPTSTPPLAVAAVAKPKVVPIVTTTATPKPVSAAQAKESETEHTREMPRLRPLHKRPAPSHPVKRLSENALRRTHAKTPQAAVKAITTHTVVADAQVDEVVVADAVRLLRWGRQWHEIAELIARMAERPNLAEVRKILRSNKPAIDQQLEA